MLEPEPKHWVTVLSKVILVFKELLGREETDTQRDVIPGFQWRGAQRCGGSMETPSPPSVGGFQGKLFGVGEA